MASKIMVAAKKAAAYFLSDKRTWTAILSIIIGVLMLFIMPAIILMSIANGTTNMNVGKEELQKSIINNLSSEEIMKLNSLDETMNNINDVMLAQGLEKDVGKAQIIYVCSLYEIAPKYPGFVEMLVTCLVGADTDEILLANIKNTFGVEISLKDLQNIMSLVKNNYIDTSSYVDANVKNNLDLVTYAKNAYENKWGYVYGAYGQVLNQKILEQSLSKYNDEVEQYLDFINENWMGGRTTDCVGLIKGYAWLNAESHEIEYGTNGMDDVNADKMYKNASVKGIINSMPETPGLAVWMKGHVGIYIGDGYVIEAQNTLNGVKMTKLEAHRWKAWFEVPTIKYIKEETS